MTQGALAETDEKTSKAKSSGREREEAECRKGREMK